MADIASQVRGRNPGLNRASDERCSLLVDGIIDGVAATGVQDLDAEDLHGRRRPLLIDTRKGDVEAQDLVVIPGSGDRSEVIHAGLTDLIEGVDGRTQDGPALRVSEVAKMACELGSM